MLKVIRTQKRAFKIASDFIDSRDIDLQYTKVMCNCKDGKASAVVATSLKKGKTIVVPYCHLCGDDKYKADDFNLFLLKMGS